MEIFDERNSLGLMIADLSRLLHKLFNQHIAAAAPISNAQWHVLVRMSQEDGLSQSELAERVEIEQPSLVRHLDNLEQMGLIERRPDKNDRRTNRVFITDACKPIFERMAPTIIALRRQITQDLDEGEFEHMMESLRKIKARTAFLLDQGQQL